MRHGRARECERSVRIDRRTKWGNPFRIGPDGDRDAVIAKYRTWLPRQPHLLAALPELRGKILMCWCKPLACHGDVLAELADRAETRRAGQGRP